LEGGAQESSNADPYWNDAIRQMLTNAIDLIKLAKPHVGGLSISVDEINRIVLSAPQSRDAVRSTTFQSGRCWSLIDAAERGTRAALAATHVGSSAYSVALRQREDLRSTIDYWLRDFAGLTDRVRSVVESSFTSKATALLRRPMSELFSPSSQRTAITPEETHRGKIVILDLSVKEYGELGRFAQILYKTVWQRATEHPSRRSFPSPVFLWADESQYFVTSEDARFQQTARSNKVATVYMTQNISNYYVSLAGRAGNAATDSLIGNFQTKIFHANTDPATNEWAERLFGDEKVTLRGKGPMSVGSMDNKTKNESWLPAIPASSYLGLLKGGALADCKVEAYVCVAGHQWTRLNDEKKPAERPGVLVTFDQNLLKPSSTTR
jgi:type IV secretory pathway TraG/TraD family ATPase VirD4